MVSGFSILFYAGLTLGRLLSGVLVEKFGAWNIIWSSSAIILLAIILMRRFNLC